MTTSEASAKDSKHRSAVDVAGAMLRGEITLLLGCRRLASLAHHIVPDWTGDRDFVVFGGVASETDDLPLGPERARWSLSALAREDAKIAEYEAAIRDTILKACRNVVVRFGCSGSSRPEPDNRWRGS